MDTAALNDALAGLRPVLIKLARLQLRNDTWAEDVVSETLIAALEGGADLRRPVPAQDLGGRDPQAQDHRPLPPLGP